MIFGASERRKKILVQHEAQRSSVGKYCYGAKHQGADLERIGTALTAVERIRKVLERHEAQWSGVEKYGSG